MGSTTPRGLRSEALLAPIGTHGEFWEIVSDVEFPWEPFMRR